MASDRINYGIDLGTTNSVLVRMQRGNPVVLKSKDAHQLDATPSAVAFTKRPRTSKTSWDVGPQARTKLQLDRKLALETGFDQQNAFVEFKRMMGSDHRYTPSVSPDRPWTPEELSAEVVKKLRSYVAEEDIRAAVVTIPASFTVPQQQATLRAAELAGLVQCCLLQEQVAAAMAYGLTSDQGT